MKSDRNRLPVWRSADKIRVHWYTWLCAADAVYALYTIFGGPGGAPWQSLARAFPFAIPLWGSALFAAALLIWFGYSMTGGAVGALCWTILTVAAVITINAGGACSPSGWVLPAWIAGRHLLVVYEAGSGLDADRERRQRRV